jgi:hypothetical protein
MGIFANCRTSKDQGNIGLSKAIYELQVLGYRISIPFTENQNYDLIVDKDNILYRVQIKTTKQKSKYDVFQVNLRTLGGNQSYHTAKKRKAGDYDLLYVLTDDNTSYLIPDKTFKAENALSLHKGMDEYIIKF